MAAVISAAPVTEGRQQTAFFWHMGILCTDNATLLSWINALTLGGMAVYVCIGITYFLTEAFQARCIDAMLSVCGFLILRTNTTTIRLGMERLRNFLYGWARSLAGDHHCDFTVEAYHFMRSHNWGRITLPPSVPASLSETLHHWYRALSSFRFMWQCMLYSMRLTQPFRGLYTGR